MTRISARTAMTGPTMIPAPLLRCPDLQSIQVRQRIFSLSLLFQTHDEGRSTDEPDPVDSVVPEVNPAVAELEAPVVASG